MRHSHSDDDDLICKLFRRLLECGGPREPTLFVEWTLRVGSLVVNFDGEFKMQLPDDKTVSATVAYVDKKGKPAKVDGMPVWASDNEAVATVAASSDGMSATITPGDDLGTAQISVTADADLGAGMKELVTLGTVEVIGGEAVAGTISFGEPS